jgi:anti-sigma factor RsiW
MTGWRRGGRRSGLRRRPRRGQVPLSCGEARETISARLDGEQLPRSRAALDAHIASCDECANFQTLAVDVAHRVALRAAKQAPDDLVAAVVSVYRPVPRPGPVGAARRRRRGVSLGRVGTVRWAGATLPVLLAFAAVSVGAGWHPRVVPTRPPSPCTAELLAHHLPLGP